MADVSSVTSRCELLGAPVSMPLGVAPVAFQRLAHPGGEVAMARAAAASGTVFTLSTIATARPSEVAAAVPEGRRWFQLYRFRDAGVTQALMDEAVDSGFEAILLTADAPRAGRRERDLRSGFAVPPDLSVPSLDAAIGGSRPVTVHEVFAQVDPTVTWLDLEALASSCALPVLVKGGRQLDCVAATAEVLPEAVEAVAGRGTVMVDGGIRRGTDVLVALALGADAALVGRPAVWGLAAGGEEGAGRVLELLREEIELGLALLGCPSPAEVGSEQVRRAA